MTDEPSVATICSHSALQIFHGARLEGLSTVGICTPERKELYNSFPRAAPDKIIEVEELAEILGEENQTRLKELNAVVVPHGSFVEYVGARQLMESFSVPVFGNKYTLEWESDRSKESRWLEEADISVPRKFESPEDIEELAIVKFSGARGGRGFFLAESKEEFERKMPSEPGADYTIQEWINGTRYYPHYYYSPLNDELQILSIDRRDESTIDEYYRGNRGDKSFVVVGNKPLTVRESLLPQLYRMGKSLIESSQDMFPPGLFGPFCLETVCTDELEFITFEVSARIVAGTNLYPQGSPYSYYYYDEPMSTGRRLARELKQAYRNGRLDEVTT